MRPFTTTKLVSVPEHNIYRNDRKKGDKPRSWSWRGKGQPLPCVVVKMKDILK